MISLPGELRWDDFARPEWRICRGLLRFHCSRLLTVPMIPIQKLILLLQCTVFHSYVECDDMDSVVAVDAAQERLAPDSGTFVDLDAVIVMHFALHCAV